VSAAELVKGRVYVLRGLSSDPRCEKTSKIPPAIGRLERVINDRSIVVKLWMGQHRWAPRARLARIDNIAREASPRESLIGFPIDPLPAAVAS
jgi:hypothetical protein